MVKYTNIVILGERVLIHTMSCATLVFEKEWKYNSPDKKDSIEALHFIINKSGMSILVNKFGLGYDPFRLHEQFVEEILNKYGEAKVSKYATHTSI